MKRNTGNGCGSRNKTNKPFGEERAEMGAEEGAKCLTDIAKIVEEKAKDIDRCHMEGIYATDKPWEEMVLWLRKARECVDSLLVAPGGQNIDMTKPQPCTKFCDAGTVDWVAKLNEEVYEAMLESAYVERLAAEADGDDVARLAEKLTEIIKVCTSWIAALGYDEAKRGELHRRVNEKYKAHGDF